jgi:methylated-DNA-protein-cysteine methyltransferase-like protein
MFNPPDPKTFNALVWEITRQVPEGKVTTYGQIASMIPPPEGVDPEQYARLGARWVGSAMYAAPPEIPWHRVINSQGEISLPKGSASADEQRARLLMEGVGFDGRGRVDFEVVGWEGPPGDWQREKGLLPPRSLKKTQTTDDPAQPRLF